MLFSFFSSFGYVARQVSYVVRYGLWYQYVDTVLDTLDHDAGGHHHRVTVDVHDIVAASLDYHALPAIDAHVMVLPQLAQKQTCANQRTLDNIERVHHRDIDQSILHGGSWSDIGVVAILCRIAASDDKGFLTHRLAIDVDDVLLGLELDVLGERRFDIGDKASGALVGKLVTDCGVKAHAASAEKWLAIDCAIVKCAHYAIVEHLQGSTGIGGNAQVACQTIA